MSRRVNTCPFRGVEGDKMFYRATMFFGKKFYYVEDDNDDSKRLLAMYSAKKQLMAIHARNRNRKSKVDVSIEDSEHSISAK
jgi:hypothetical protein